MKTKLSGFRRFFEMVTGAPTRPDQASGHGKDGNMDSISVQAMELGVPEKTFASIPWSGANIQIGQKIMGGNSSMEVMSITDKTVTLRVRDDGTKRFVRTPGSLYNDPKPGGEERVITVPRAYFVKMCDDQYGGSSGAMASGGGGGGLPPM